jgi:hypothetical protein
MLDCDECLRADGSHKERRRLSAENAKLRALCRDMYLVVELLDMDGARLQAHGRDADWRTLKERYDGLGVDE